MMELKIDKIPELGELQAHVNSSDIELCLSLIQQQGIDYIKINSSHGWIPGTKLDFLKEHTWIKGLWIVDENIDITPVNYLTNLEYFGCSGSKYFGCFDFKGKEQMYYLTITWDKKLFKNFESCHSLRQLNFYKFPCPDLTLIGHFTNLEKLEFYFSRFENLSGIENLSHLQKLKIYSAPKLQNIDALVGVSQHLKNLFFELCSNINSFKVLDKMPNLESFYIFRSSPIHSAQFIKQLNNLRYAYIGTEILDGDVEFLKERKIEYKKLKKYAKIKE